MMRIFSLSDDGFGAEHGARHFLVRRRRYWREGGCYNRSPRRRLSGLLDSKTAHAGGNGDGTNDLLFLVQTTGDQGKILLLGRREKQNGHFISTLVVGVVRRQRLTHQGVNYDGISSLI